MFYQKSQTWGLELKDFFFYRIVMSSPASVTVIWDFQYAWIPEGYDLRSLKTSIESALKRCNPDFFIEGKLIALGHATGDRHQAITMLPDDFELSPVQRDNVPTPDPEDSLHVFFYNWSDLVCDISNCFLKLSMKVLDNKANVLVISGNHDVMRQINRWKQRGIFMMLALPESSDPSFYHCANVTWLLSSEDPERAAATMVNGGGPIPPVPRIRGIVNLIDFCSCISIS
ncbi:hypothetical protein HID58_079502 [Brassica napus]|uniref:NYN domain-containing protein n=1 Tax=Brassica napus TaxID=3708 RepID=A0ABQ7Y283_BRANA|nr:hypothetical protein HID58_079502 [Brassica napus]